MADAKPRKLRWKFPLIVLLLGTAATVGCWFYFAGNLTMQVFGLYPIWSATVFVLVLWWVLWSGVTWKTRLRGLAVVAALAGLFVLVMKFDRFDGAMIPKFSTRWANPFWPAFTYAVGAVCLLAFGLSWILRGACVATIIGAVALFTGVLGFDGFDLKADPNWAALQKGDRSKESEFGAGTWANDWPQFRGPKRDGIIRNANVRTNWTDEKLPPLMWKHPVGNAWSSFAIAGGRAITQEQRSDTNRESVVCYDFKTGTQIWQHTDDSHFESVQGGTGPRATPTVVGRRVYTLGATGVLNCLDLDDGRQYWERNILTDAGTENISWGMAGSPLIYGESLFVAPGGSNNAAVIAYNRIDGSIQWKSDSRTAGYSSPVIHKLHGMDVLLIYDGDGLSAYEPKTGRPLFHYGWSNTPKINVALPIVHGNRILISSGYSTGCALLEPSIDDGKWAVREVWKKNNLFRLKFNDGILVEQDGDAYVYGLDETILKCLRLSDGKIMWRKRGIQQGPGGNYGYGQMLLTGDTLIITAETGWVSFVQVSPQGSQYLGGFQGLNRGLGALDTKGNGWNQPVLHKGRLLLRNELEAACYDVGAK